MLIPHTTDPAKTTAIITVIGQDKVGIIAGVSSLLAEVSANINDISQTILHDVFTMIMIVDLSKATVDIKTLADRLEKKGLELGLSIRIQHSDIFNAMHRI